MLYNVELVRPSASQIKQLELEEGGLFCLALPNNCRNSKKRKHTMDPENAVFVTVGAEQSQR